jgi:hypothetical protein
MFNRKRIHELEQQVIMLQKQLEREQTRGETFHAVKKEFDITPLLPQVYAQVIKDLEEFIQADFIRLLKDASRHIQEQNMPSLTAYAAVSDIDRMARIPVYTIEVRMSSGGARFKLAGY